MENKTKKDLKSMSLCFEHIGEGCYISLNRKLLKFYFQSFLLGVPVGISGDAIVFDAVNIPFYPFRRSSSDFERQLAS